ncbi:hypothetical protein A3K63_02715 [Candidatus Micrarchaeota archaeon RBG_16_49_10]|nr:MAG: hypothetical protein A3K63_02715 [Candidatus Micrarchaeota archaeon RBG_16_49_10]
MLDHGSLRDHFNYRKPTPSKIERKYGGQVVDLSNKKLPFDDILYSIITLGNKALILPDEYRTELLQVPDYSLDSYRPGQRHFVHWRYADDVKLTTTEMSVGDAESQKFSLKSVMKDASWDWKEPHRGFGVVDVRGDNYTLWPFIYILEGIRMQHLSSQLVKKVSSEGFDVVGEAPSLTKPKFHNVTVKNVPYRHFNDFYALAMQTHSACDCEWPQFGPRKTDKRRYVGDERIMCRHAIALSRHLIEESTGKILDFLPELTGIMDPYWKLKDRVIFGDSKLGITQMNSLVGSIIAYMGVEEAFDLASAQ